LRLHGRAEHAAGDTVAARQERGPGHHEIRLRCGNQGDQLGHRALGLLGGVVVAAGHRGHDRAGVAQRLLYRARGSYSAVHRLWAHAGLILAAELAEELVDEADDAQRLRLHHRTSAITRVAPTCSIAPHTAPYVVATSPTSFGARSSAPTTRSIAGRRSGSWLLPTFTIASTPGRSNSSIPSALPSVDMSSTSTVVHTPRASHWAAAWAMSPCGAPPPILVSTAPSAPSAWATSPAARNAERTRSGWVAWATVRTTPANQSVRPCCA